LRRPLKGRPTATKPACAGWRSSAVPTYYTRIRRPVPIRSCTAFSPAFSPAVALLAALCVWC